MTALVIEEATLAAMESEHFIVFTPCASPYITAPSSATCTPEHAELRQKKKKMLSSSPKCDDFAFFSGNVSGRLVSAEELFDSGVIRPLKPKNMGEDDNGVVNSENCIAGRGGGGRRRRSGLCPLVVCEGWKPLKELLPFGRNGGKMVGREEEGRRRQKVGEEGRGGRRRGRIMIGCSKQQGFLKRFWFNQSGLVKNVSPLPSRG